MRAPRLVAGVVAQLQEFLHVRMPRLQVHAGRALALAALVDRRHRRIQRLQPRHDAVGMAVGGPDQRAARTHAGEADADAAAELGQLGDVAVLLVDRLQRIDRRIQQEAARQLLVRGAGVEQRRRTRQVVQVAHAPVQRQRLGHVLAQRAGDAQEELLRGLDDLARMRMAQQVAVVQGAQAEVVEAAVQRRVQRIVQLARVGLHETEQAVVDQADFMAAQDRLRERVDFLPGHFLGDGVGQQARGQAAVFGLLGGQQRGGADGQLIQLARGGAVVQAADGARGHAHRVDRVQAVAVALHRAHDLVEIDGFLARRCASSRSSRWRWAAGSAERRCRRSLR